MTWLAFKTRASDPKLPWRRIERISLSASASARHAAGAKVQRRRGPGLRSLWSKPVLAFVPLPHTVLKSCYLAVEKPLLLPQWTGGVN